MVGAPRRAFRSAIVAARDALPTEHDVSAPAGAANQEEGAPVANAYEASTHARARFAADHNARVNAHEAGVHDDGVCASAHGANVVARAQAHEACAPCHDDC